MAAGVISGNVREQVAGFTAQAVQPDEIAELSDQIRKALECPVCMEVNVDMDCYCPNGHVLCGPCLIELCSSKATDSCCPICRALLTYTNDGQLTVRRMALALPLISVACRYRSHGCHALVRVDQVARHEDDCEYWPDVRCLVTACRWLGTYDKLFDHAIREHPHFAVHTTNDSLMVMDANQIESYRRRVYLVKTNDSGALLWVLISRVSRNRIQAGVFMVESKYGRGRTVSQRSASNMGYRVTYFDSRGRYKTRSQTCRVGRWHSSMNMISSGDKSEWFTVFRSGKGCVEVKWFDRESVHPVRRNSRPVN